MKLFSALCVLVMLIIAGATAWGTASVNWNESKTGTTLRADSICFAVYASSADANYSILSNTGDILKRGTIHFENKTFRDLPGIKTLYQYVMAKIGTKEGVIVSNISDPTIAEIEVKE